MQNETFLNLRQTAAYLDITVSQMYKLTHLKKIRHYKPQGKKIYFLKSDLEKFIMQRGVIYKEEGN